MRYFVILIMLSLALLPLESEAAASLRAVKQAQAKSTVIKADTPRRVKAVTMPSQAHASLQSRHYEAKTNAVNVLGETQNLRVEVLKPASCSYSTDGEAQVVLSNILHAHSTFTFAWNTIPVQTGMVAKGLAPGEYTVAITNGEGKTFHQSVEVKAKTHIRANVIVERDASYEGRQDGVASVHVPATEGTQALTYEWHTTPPQYGPTAIDLAAGMHLVTISSPEGCETTEAVSIINRQEQIANAQPLLTAAPNSVSAPFFSSLEVSPQIYPNPTRGDFYVSLDTRLVTDEQVDIALQDMSGATVYHQIHPIASRITIEANKLPQGVYFMQMRIDGQSYRQRVIVK